MCGAVETLCAVLRLPRLCLIGEVESNVTSCFVGLVKKSHVTEAFLTNQNKTHK